MNHRNITYHKIFNVSNFEKHISLLKRCKSVTITCDDGDPSFYHNAFPVLKEHNLRAILFIITELIDTETPFWWDEIEFHLGPQEGRSMVRKLKKVTNQQRLKHLEEIRKKSKKPAFKYKQLTRTQLREMHDAGIIIANHSHTHPMFDQVSDEEMKMELMESKRFFADLGFGKFDWFAYPNGNHTLSSEQMLKESGIKKAFLFDHKLNSNANPLRVSRLSVDDSTPLWKLRLIISGLHSRIVPITRKVHQFLS